MLPLQMFVQRRKEWLGPRSEALGDNDLSVWAYSQEPAMTFINITSIKERIAIGEALNPAERDFVLDCITGAVEKPRALADEKIDAGAAAKEGLTLSREIQPLLHGKSRPVQSTALADLLSLWIAGHVRPGDRTGTDNYRNAVLVMHMEQVRDLVEISSRQIGAEAVIDEEPTHAKPS